MIARLCLLLLTAAVFGVALPAHAHKASDSYLALRVHDDKLDGQWDIALRDLEMAIGIDRNGNGELTWDEIRTSHADIAAYALSRLHVANAGESCALAPREHLIDQHSDGAYAVMRFTVTCNAPIDALDIRYNLLFDIDPQHKGLLKLEQGDRTSTGIFSPDQMQQQFALADANKPGQFIQYLKHGVWHIWIGFDHILFLVSLLLPAVLFFTQGKWRASESFKASFIDVLRIVTAFTVAHSITLILATLQIVALPSRWVETAIAASVVIAAINNVLPFFQGKRWIAAFAFGLVHGFGFSSVLGDLGLPPSSLILALVGFNIGVELGQIAIVAAFLPIAYALRKQWLYRRVIFTGGSVAIALVATIWMIERAFDLPLYPLRA